MYRYEIKKAGLETIASRIKADYIRNGADPSHTALRVCAEGLVVLSISIASSSPTERAQAREAADRIAIRGTLAGASRERAA